MSDVEFFEGGNNFPLQSHQQAAKGIIGFMLKHKIVKTVQQANIVLVIVAIVCLVLACYLFSRAYSLSNPHVLIYKEDITDEDREKYSPSYLNSLPSKQDEI